MTSLASPRVDALMQIFAQLPGRSYALLDAARSRNLLMWINQCGMRSQSLYAGTSAITLREQAPYLVELNLDSPAMEMLLEHGWGKSLGLFVNSHAAFDALRITLKKKLVVRDAKGRRLYFRFYDPRVARTFITATALDGLRHYFEGGLEAYVIEAFDANAIAVMPRGGSYVAKQIAIPPARQSPPPTKLDSDSLTSFTPVTTRVQ
jgi:Domain of unknown function (DUF4123)